MRFISSLGQQPWTLPSNTALTVGPKIDYFSKTFNQYTFSLTNLILAKKTIRERIL
jgi:isoleucyl-tRNA synthetase